MDIRETNMYWYLVLIYRWIAPKYVWMFVCVEREIANNIMEDETTYEEYVYVCMYKPFGKLVSDCSLIF